MSKHFHVISGLAGGYIPNTNEVYTTKREAIQGAMFHVEQYREAGERVRGSIKAGYWQARESESHPGVFWDYVEIGDACFDPEHDPETWEWD